MFHLNYEKEYYEDKSDIVINTADSIRTKALAGATSRHDSAAIEKVLEAAEPYMYRRKGTQRSGTVQQADTVRKANTVHKADTVRNADSLQTETTPKKKKKNRFNFNVTNPDKKYTSFSQYDSAQKALPKDKRDNRLERLAKRREIELNVRYKGDQKAMWKDLLEKFTHTFPYLLFVSLPLYAFYLKLLYWRRKQFLYVTHGIFLIYLYIFTFIDLLVYFGLDKIHDSMDWGWMGWIEAAVLLYGIYYAYKAMRRFYGQGRGKTILKFFILNTFAFWSVVILFTAFFLFAVFKF